jgi:hypothetical protein
MQDKHQVREVDLARGLPMVNIISEEDILRKIAVCFNRPKDLTVFFAVVDPEVWKDGPPKFKLPKDKDLIWSEPVDGVYLINLPLMSMFKPKLTSVEELFKEIVDCGFKIESKRFSVPAKSRLVDIKKTKDKLSIAIVCMFSPKGFVAYWEQYLIDAQLPENVSVDVVVGDNTNKEEFKNWFDGFKERMSEKYNAVYRVDLGAPHRAEEDMNYVETNRHAHVARTYSKFLSQLVDSYDYILTVEDDMEPTQDGLVLLYEHIKTLEDKNIKAAAVAGYYPQKMDPNTACISLQPKVWGKIPKIKNVKPRLFKVEMQGGGFTLYDTRAIKKVLPYRLVFKTLNGNFYMTGWDGYIGEEWSKLGWKQYCDGSILCNHHF